MFVVLSNETNTDYSIVISRHRTREKAEEMLEKKSAKVLRKTPDAITYLMFDLSESDAPIGVRAKFKKLGL